MTSPNDLAAGFAEHVQRWAAGRGASIAALAVLKVAAERASLAAAEGHVCIPLATIAASSASPDALRELLLSSGMAGTPQGEPLPSCWMRTDSISALLRLRARLRRTSCAAPPGRNAESLERSRLAKYAWSREPPALRHQRRAGHWQDHHRGGAARPNPRGTP
jgi:hypothetical protein